MEKSVSVTFCTIVTQSHLAWAFSLNHSLQQFDKAVNMCILVTDTTKVESLHLQDFPNTHIIYLKDLLHIQKAKKIIQKYASQPNEQRWSLKPILIMYLLSRYEKVLCCDCDLFFFQPYQFLVDDLDSHNVLLTPHWLNIEPQQNIEQFEAMLWHGIYNAGFVAANQKGYKAMETWANLCLYKCEKDKVNGYYDDQRYLDLLPTYFENIKIIRHKGCNVANWNIDVCQRTLQKNGEVWINGQYPIVFVHITENMLRSMLSGQDKLLYQHIETFKKVLLSYSDTIEQHQDKFSRKYDTNINVLQRIKNKFYSFLKLIYFFLKLLFSYENWDIVEKFQNDLKHHSININVLERLKNSFYSFLKK